MKIKKILSAATALAMGVTMMCATSLTASAIEFDSDYNYTAISVWESLSDEYFSDLLEIATADGEHHYTISVMDISLYEQNKQYIIPSNLSIKSNFVLYSGAYITLESGADFILDNGSDSERLIRVIDLSALKNMQDLYRNNVTMRVDTKTVDVFSSDLAIQNHISIDISKDSELGNGITQTYNDGLKMSMNGYSFTNKGTLKVKNGLEIDGGKMTNNGDLYIDGAVAFTYNGTLTNSGKIYSDDIYMNQNKLIADGTLVNTGKIYKSDGSYDEKTPVTTTTKIPQPTYTVTIPDKVEFGQIMQALPKYKDDSVDNLNEPVVVSKNFTVTAECKNLFEKKLYVSIGKAEDSSFVLKGDSTSIPATITCGDEAYTMGENFATFEDSLNPDSSNTQSGKISINRTTISENAAYTGTLTFNISVE